MTDWAIRPHDWTGFIGPTGEYVRLAGRGEHTPLRKFAPARIPAYPGGVCRERELTLSCVQERLQRIEVVRFGQHLELARMRIGD